jgi:hypothetical protein
MRYYAADTDSGETYYALAGNLTRGQFADAVLAYMESSPDDEHTPQAVTLHAFESAGMFAAWVDGVSGPPDGWTWTSLARRSEYGRVAWVFPGVWQRLELGEKEPRPSAAWMAENHPETREVLADMYGDDDPKGWAA